jgi:hypothetical protein
MRSTENVVQSSQKRWDVVKGGSERATANLRMDTPVGKAPKPARNCASVMEGGTAVLARMTKEGSVVPLRTLLTLKVSKTDTAARVPSKRVCIFQFKLALRRCCANSLMLFEQGRKARLTFRTSTGIVSVRGGSGTRKKTSYPDVIFDQMDTLQSKQARLRVRFSFSTAIVGMDFKKAMNHTTLLPTLLPRAQDCPTHGRAVTCISKLCEITKAYRTAAIWSCLYLGTRFQTDAGKFCPTSLLSIL